MGNGKFNAEGKSCKYGPAPHPIHFRGKYEPKLKFPEEWGWVGGGHRVKTKKPYVGSRGMDIFWKTQFLPNYGPHG